MLRDLLCSARSLALVLVAAAVAGVAPASAQQPTAPGPAAAAEADSSTISPRGAMLRSLVLPGWGQSYVGAPGRGAIYFALEAGSLWMTYKTLRSLSDARRLEDYLRETGQLEPDERLAIAQSREEQREDRIALSLFLLLASAADAYVSAQLADFDRHIGVSPSPSGGLLLEARVPLGRPR